jgi:hypothetical protein
MREHVATQVCNGSLAERGNEIDARRAGEREHGHDRDHHAEIAVDHVDAVGGEAEVDHPPHGSRYHKRGERRHGERDQRGGGFGAIARQIGDERKQWT